MENDDRKWEILQSEYLIKRPWLTARRDRVRLPNGVINDEYYVLEYPDWVNVIAITKEGDFLMERQYRHGLQWTGYELCAGVCEASGYSIRVNDLYLGTNAVYADVDLLGPEAGEDITELPTTPYIVLKIQKREESVVFCM